MLLAFPAQNGADTGVAPVCTGATGSVTCVARTLTSCNGQSLSANQHFDSCLFSSGFGVCNDCTMPEGIVITNSKIVGVISAAYDNSQNLQMSDVEDDGSNNSNQDCTNGLDGWSGTRLNFHGCAKAFSGSGPVSVTNSYCHDISGHSGSHNECVLFNGTGPIVVQHNNLIASWLPSNSGGMSGVLQLYASVGSPWGPLANALLDSNRLENPNQNAVYCMYPNNNTQAGAQGTNITVTNNRFASSGNAGCGPSHVEDGWFYNGTPGCQQNGSTCVWSGNTFDDGSTVNP
jgi:hypothetical protein